MAKHEERPEANFVEHVPCDKCGSSDAAALYDDGHTFCFSCGVYAREEDAPTEAIATRAPPAVPRAGLLEGGLAQALTTRGIRKETCAKFSYLVGRDRSGKAVQIATYRDRSGAVVAQKLRYADKSFTWTGTPKGVALFGEHLWAGGGKKIVVTEGEIDCLSVSHIQNDKWPVVSLPNGAQAAAKSIAKSLEFLDTFDQVILFFDNDEVGQEAAKEAAAVLPPGKALIANLNAKYKDANDALKAGDSEAISQAIWNAKPYRPDGLVSLSDLRDELLKPVEWGLPYWDDRLTKATYGRRMGEVVGIGAGTGIGKTDWIMQQVAFDVMELKLPVGLIFLEQQPKETGQRLAGKIDGVRYHVPDSGADPDKMMETVDKIAPFVTLYDSFGQTDWDVVKAKIRYMAHSLDTKVFYLDHLTALADTEDEKGSLEQIMKELAGLANELKVWILFVSHLTTPEGKPHEEGGRVMIRHFKGSRAIGFWSYFMFGLERNQQADDDEVKQTTTFRILKDRYTGQSTGNTYLYGYDFDLGRLIQKAPEDYHPEPISREDF